MYEKKILKKQLCVVRHLGLERLSVVAEYFKLRISCELSCICCNQTVKQAYILVTLIKVLTD